MLQSGVQLLDRFAQDDRVGIRQPRCNSQIKFTALAGRTTSWPDCGLGASSYIPEENRSEHGEPTRPRPVRNSARSIS